MTEKLAINFTHKFKKLDLDKFTTIRWLDSRYDLGRTYEIFYIADNLFHTHYSKGFVRIIKMEIVKLANLSLQEIRLDAECDREAFYKMMEGWYSKKPDWKGEDSEVQILYLERLKKK
jgi:hypothetical protein